MSTITKDQAKDLHNAFQCWQQDYDPVEDKEQYDMFGLGIVAMDALLASLEAEPIYQLWDEGYYDTEKETYDAVLKAGGRGRIVYTAPPAPVSDSLLSELLSIAKRAADEADECAHAEFSDDSMEHSAAIVDWERRAAMLQGAEPVTTAYKLPDDFDFDRFNDVVWLEAVASNPHMHSLTTSTIAMVALELNKRMNVANSPAIPDGWVMVPVEPTEDMIVNGFESEPDESFSDEREWEAYDAMSGCQQAAHRAKLCWAAMIAAAPKPEVK
ncbi:hypothetical protein ACQWYW_001023 [Enterobacter cloacae]